MTLVGSGRIAVRNPDLFYIGGEWVAPSSTATFDVVDSTTEEVFLQVAEAHAADLDRAVTAARTAFDEGPWPRLSHSERGEYVRAFAAGWRARAADVAEVWPRESGVLQSLVGRFMQRTTSEYDYYAGLAGTFPFEEPAEAFGGGAGLQVREPVGVVGAIIPWNGPVSSIAHKLAPALLTGCTFVLKSSPEAPAEGLIAAEIAHEIGLPPGVFNVVTADREVSELLVRDPRVDKIAFTGSTVAGKRIGSICAERVARCSLELGGKSAAVILDDADIDAAATVISGSACNITGQVCSSLTRIVVTRTRYAELVDALAAAFSAVKVGDPFDPESQMGPLVTERQRERVEGYIAKGRAEEARLVTGGGRPKHLNRGFYVEPTVFADVHNDMVIAREEIFGPVLSVIPVADEAEAVNVANDTVYGLNASVFTPDVVRAREVAAQLKSGTVGHNSFRSDYGIAFGGFKQSGIGREGGLEGLRLYLETKTVILERPIG